MGFLLLMIGFFVTRNASTVFGRLVFLLSASLSLALYGWWYLEKFSFLRGWGYHEGTSLFEGKLEEIGLFRGENVFDRVVFVLTVSTVAYSLARFGIGVASRIGGVKTEFPEK
jgi:hypothetical protein